MGLGTGQGWRIFQIAKKPRMRGGVGGRMPTPERLEAARHRCLIDEGLEDRFPGTWGILFDVGGAARMNGIGFDEGRTKPWQEGWIAGDINMGLAGVE